MNGNIPLAVIAGAIAALIGGAIWAAITLATNFQIGFMAVGVGFLVGLAVRIGGSGASPVFGIIGALFALLGCMLGNLLTAIGYVAEATEMSYVQALTSFDFSLTLTLMKETFHPMDILFYGIAVYEGFKFGTVEE